MCFCLKTFYLIYIFNIELSANSNTTHAWTRILSLRHITAFFCLGTLGSTSVLQLGTILNSKITNKKQEKVKNKALNRPQKEFVYSIRDEARRQRVTLFNLSQNVSVGQLKIFTALLTSTNYHLVLILGYVNFSKWSD